MAVCEGEELLGGMGCRQSLVTHMFLSKRGSFGAQTLVAPLILLWKGATRGVRESSGLGSGSYRLLPGIKATEHTEMKIPEGDEDSRMQCSFGGQ